MRRRQKTQKERIDDRTERAKYPYFKIRIVIEHIINGVKRCRIVKDLFRNTKEKYDDLVMEIACGLHNFRVECRDSYSR